MVDRRAHSPNESAAMKTAGFFSVLSRNIAAIAERRRQEEASVGWQERLAAVITSFTGSMTFVYLHLVLFSFWVAANVGALPMVPAFDPNFIILGTSASVEAIFLSTFILISQNRMASSDRKRADLDLQVTLLSEHEITRIATLLTAIADKLGVQTEIDPSELEEITREVPPEIVLDELDKPPTDKH